MAYFQVVAQLKEPSYPPGLCESAWLMLSTWSMWLTTCHAFAISVWVPVTIRPRLARPDAVPYSQVVAQAMVPSYPPGLCESA